METDRFNPMMLQLLREARALTQSGLAGLAGVQQGHISKIEHAQTMPSDEVVAKLAAALQVPASFFYQAEMARELPVVFYRKRKSLGANALKMIHARVNLLRMRVKTLLQSVDVPDGKVPFIDLAKRRDTAEDVAAELRIGWRIPEGPFENLTKTIEDAGIPVVLFEFDSLKIDGMSIYEPQDGMPPIIFVSRAIPGDRLRWTLAHELAHIVLHHHLPIPPDNFESQADEFAAELLMPKRSIRPHLIYVSLERVAALKTTWKVAMQALLRRAKSIGTLSERQYQYLMMKLSAAGWKTREPVEVSREEPSLVTEMARFHIEDLGYSEEQLCSVLHLGLPEFRDTFGVGPAAGASGLRVIK